MEIFSQKVSIEVMDKRLCNDKDLSEKVSNQQQFDNLKSNYNSASVGKKQAENGLIEAEVIIKNLQDELDEVTMELEKQLDLNKDLEDRFEKKKEQVIDLREVLQNEKMKVEELESKCNELEMISEYNKDKVEELEKQISEEREWNEEAMLKKDKEVNQLCYSF